MSFLSKLFGGDKNAEKAAKDILNGLFAEANKNQNNNQQQQKKEETKPAQEQQQQQTYDPELSEWEQIPNEECQYNYSGSFEQYFENIFAADFPAYRTEKSYVNKPDCKKRVAYTFYNGAAKVLVVELMSESCEAKKFREDVKRSGVSYLRFYYDHEGWWNKRSYVTSRIRAILG